MEIYTVIEKVIFLQDIDVFKEVRVEDLAHLAAIAEEVSYLPGTHLYEVNDSPDALYLVINGKVRLHREGQEINVVGAGEALGTWALFDNQPRVATATALEPTDVLRIDRDDFYDLLSDHVRIAEAVLRSLARRLRALVERIN
ncbi:MAG: cyclic nucleotide-binding domain-containing protein [Calditrichaeota bacterium]|nr:MAG: cyclic nucleotide-binding domain-containing protein [Calditrichota bacterium]